MQRQQLKAIGNVILQDGSIRENVVIERYWWDGELCRGEVVIDGVRYHANHFLGEPWNLADKVY